MQATRQIVLFAIFLKLTDNETIQFNLILLMHGTLSNMLKVSVLPRGCAMLKKNSMMCK